MVEHILKTVVCVVVTVSGALQRQPQLVYSTPSAISREQLDAFASTLGLSEAQHQFAERVRAGYVEHVERAMGARRIELDAYSREAGRGMSRGEYDILSLKGYEEMCRIEAEAVEWLDRADQRLFDELESVLSPAQIELLTVVRLRRSRQYMVPDSRPYELASIDLVGFFQRPDVRALISRGGGDLNPRDVDSMLFEYDRRVTPLWLAYEKEAARIRVPFAYLIHEMQFDDSGSRMEVGSREEVARSLAVLPKIESLMRHRTELQQRIAETAQTTFEGIVARMQQPRTSASLQLLWNATCFPQVYADDIDTAAILTSVIDSAPSQESRSALESAIQAHRRAWEQICKEMADRTRQWRLQYSATQSMSGHQLFRQELRELRSRRWNLDVTTTEQAITLCEALGIEACRRLKEHLAKCRIAIQNGANDDFPQL